MRTLAIGLAAAFTAVAGWGQLGGTLGGATSGGMGGRGGNPGNPNSVPMGEPYPANQRSIYVSGKVVVSDGAALPQAVKIDRACGGSVRVAGYTDVKGRFNIDLSRNDELPDISSHTDETSGPSGMPSRGRDRSTSLLNCELHFTLPGFRQESLSLSDSRYLDNPDVGTIILKRIANVEGLTVSATSALAPKDAKKAYEKGVEAAGKRNTVEAQKEFEKAVGIYPRYAAAWYELGRLQEQVNQFDDARKDYGQAVAADAKYIPPYERLSWIALRETKWQEMADDTNTILRLDPIDYVDAYYLSGVANLQLGNLDAAEKSAREALDRDKTHRNARAPYLLGLVLARKHDYAGAAPLLRTFLEQNPNVEDAPNVRQQLASIEQAADLAARGNAAAPGKSAQAETPDKRP
jgi:tetratricopeptide (TPR) repeat protein